MSEPVAAPWEPTPEELTRLRREYRDIVGKNPGTMSADNMAARIAAAKHRASKAGKPGESKPSGKWPKTITVHTIAGQVDLLLADRDAEYRFVQQAERRLPMRQSVAVDTADGKIVTFLPSVGFMVREA